MKAPTAGRDSPTEVFWGDTHVHSKLSTDAAAYGNRLGLDDAYRFARGEEVISSAQQKVRLNQALDFMVVADHTDGAVFFDLLAEVNPEIMKEPLSKRWHKMIAAGELFKVARRERQNLRPTRRLKRLLLVEPLPIGPLLPADSASQDTNFTRSISAIYTGH